MKYVNIRQDFTFTQRVLETPRRLSERKLPCPKLPKDLTRGTYTFVSTNTYDKKFYQQTLLSLSVRTIDEYILYSVKIRIAW